MNIIKLQSRLNQLIEKDNEKEIEIDKLKNEIISLKSKIKDINKP